MMVEGKLAKANKLFFTVCAHLASVNSEFGLPTVPFLTIIDRITIVWSVVIFITSLLKFHTFKENPPQDLNDCMTGEHLVSFRDVLLLNYLPCVNEFGKLYYGLVSVSIGSPLAWRLYLSYYKQARHMSPNLDAKRKLVIFFLEGSTSSSKQSAGIHPTGIINASIHSKNFDWPLLADNEVFKGSDVPSTKAEANCKPLAHLSYLHHGQSAIRGKDKLARVGFFNNPIRSLDYVTDRTETRWRYLVRHVYKVLSIIAMLSLPILCFTIEGLQMVMHNFSPSSDKVADLNRVLNLYGYMEQFYACTQGALFFVFTNIFITLFHIDLINKFRPVKRDLQWLNMVQVTGGIDEVKSATTIIRAQQMRLWAYFDNIAQLDSFVSKYSVISMITFIIGISFGQSFLKVEERSLKTGTAAVLISNFLSFSYLYLISWDIEQRVSAARSFY